MNHEWKKDPHPLRGLAPNNHRWECQLCLTSTILAGNGLPDISGCGESQGTRVYFDCVKCGQKMYDALGDAQRATVRHEAAQCPVVAHVLRVREVEASELIAESLKQLARRVVPR